MAQPDLGSSKSGVNRQDPKRQGSIPCSPIFSLPKISLESKWRVVEDATYSGILIVGFFIVTYWVLF
jgi:hypothetical protein